MKATRCLVKLADNPATKRARSYMGVSDMKEYTVEADVLANEKRRQMGDAGIVAPAVFAHTVRQPTSGLSLNRGSPKPARTVKVPFAVEGRYLV